MPLRSLIHFLQSRESRRSHAVLLISSLATGIGLYGFHRYQTLTMVDLFRPEPIWLVYWLPVALAWYSGWISWSMILSRWQHTDLVSTMREDAVCYAPSILILGLWGKHLELPAILAVIPAVSGMIALKLRPFLYLIRPRGLPHWVCPVLVFGCMAAYTVTFSIMGSLRFLAFRSFVDFSLFVQQVWNYSNFEYHFLSNMGWLPFANHFSPVIFLIAPFYWIWESPITIIIFYNTVIALGALPLYWLARERLGSPTAGLVVAVAYLLYPAIQFPSLGDFHESLLIGTPVIFGFYFLYKQLYRKAWFFILLVLMCKEDTPFIIFMFGLYVWFIQHQRKQGLAITGIAILWFVVSVGIIVPMAQGGANWYLQFLPGTASPADSSVSFAERLNDLAVHFFSIKNLRFLLQLLIPVGALALLAPAELFIGIPTLLELMLYTGPPFGLVGTIYTWHVAAVVPVFFIGAIFGVEWLGNAAWFQNIPGNKAPRAVCLAYLCLSSICGSLAYGAFPYSVTFRWEDFQITPHDRIGHEILKTIPSEVAVTTTSQISAHLAHRKELYMLPIPFKPGGWMGDEALLPKAVDYVVVDTSAAVLAEMTSGQNISFLKEVRNITQNSDYETVLARDGYIVFRHIHRTTP